MQRQRFPVSFGLALLVVLAVLILNFNFSSAQVTFSRDWNAGKRAMPECTASLKSAAGICHMLLNELRAIASCEVRARLSEEDTSPEVFVSSHSGRR